MGTFLIILGILLITPTPALFMKESVLLRGLSFSVENPLDILTSPNNVFSAGFYQVGVNAFCFAIWFQNSVDKTVVWIANRDQPVNGKHSKLKLSKDGNLLLMDADRITVWSTNTFGGSTLQLLDSGNLVLKNSSYAILWQSFDFPTNTLLANQLLTRKVSLISYRSQTDYSSGFYKFYFDNDNVVRLLFSDGTETSSVYWPDIGLVSWEAGRTTFNDSRVAFFDSYGHFQSSDNLLFDAADFGVGHQRRLTLDFDGNLRMYSLAENGQWLVTWEAFFEQCNVNGLCGPNNLCKYTLNSGRKCACLPGFRLKNHANWMHGCEPEFQIPSNTSQVDFIGFPHVEFYGYDLVYLFNYTFESCRDYCLQLKDCKAFLLKYDHQMFKCYPKARLLNGFQASYFKGTLYLKVPKNINNSIISPSRRTEDQLKLHCEAGNIKMIQLERDYRTKDKGMLKFLLRFAIEIGITEIACVLLVWFFVLRGQSGSSKVTQDYDAIVGFKRFSYGELKKATRNFREQVGKGAYGVVYKGKLSDGRIAAIKKLAYTTGQGEAEFLAEVSILARLNHKNLIEIWGYCAQGKERLLVLEYMENKSLAEKLASASLNWETRYEIALGTARSLAYLHEECMEWILHCDVKPQNILLDENFHPKVADFGLSMLINQNGEGYSSFSRIRGTRGYMAPEWVTNIPITSKVDVYSYGIVLLEIVTGKNPSIVDIVTWVREKQIKGGTSEAWIEDILDPLLEGKFNLVQVQTLILVGLQCVKEDKDARPTMSQVVETLQGDHTIP
ncbi:unnamed protein product [Amaranthus hypochondriacus]